jgi:hypothetical protein
MSYGDWEVKMDAWYSDECSIVHVLSGYRFTTRDNLNVYKSAHLYPNSGALFHVDLPIKIEKALAKEAWKIRKHAKKHLRKCSQGSNAYRSRQVWEAFVKTIFKGRFDGPF